MKRNTILAATIAAAFSAPLTAFADTANVNVYGKFDLSYDVINTGNAATGTTSGRVSSNTSRIGFKGSEDLGDGLSAIWQVESQLNVGDATAATLGSRNTYAGVKNDSYGTLLAGRYDTPYRLSTRRFDLFSEGVADNRSIFGGVANSSAVVAFDGRQNQVVAYTSPNFAGFTCTVAYANLNPALTVGTVGANANTVKQTALSAAGSYEADGLYAAAAYEVHNLAVTAATAGTAAAASATAVLVSEKAARLGIGYAHESFSLNAAYEKTGDNYGVAHANKYGHNAFYVSGKFNLPGNTAVKAALTRQSNVGNVANTGVSQYSLGFDHSLSKRTTAYVLYSKIRNGSAANFGLANNGTAGVSSIVGFGASPSVIAAGFAHSF